MAFTDEAIKAKLSSLNESQDSISTVSQWIMFHRRHADRTAQIWMQRIKESTPNKKLSLIYLANEIVQQSKLRKKEEFLRAYDPIIVEATEAAYKGSSSDVQNKIRRVIEVWRARAVFRQAVQEQIEATINELDRTRSSRKPALGGSLFSGSVPPELTSVAPLATSVQKADINLKPALAAANQDYDKLTSPSNAIPSPPMHAAGLAALVKKLATAEGAVAEMIKARQSLISGLEQLLEANKTKLSTEQAQSIDLGARKEAVNGRMREVEEGILKGLSAAEQNAISAAPLSVVGDVESGSIQRGDPPERPDIEALTPPPMESFTPVGSPKLEPPPHIPDDVFGLPVRSPVEPIAALAPLDASSISAAATAIGLPNIPGADLLNSLTHTRPDDGTNGGNYHTATFKKRKMSRSTAEDEFAAFAGDGDLDGIDANVGDLI